MLGGESEVGNSGIDALLLDFMRVVIAQYKLFCSSPLNDSNSSVRLNLQHSADIFAALRLERQTVATQWMMILKLYRLGCLKEINTHFNGKSSLDTEAFLNFRFDYTLIDPEVELVLLTDRFQAVIKELEQSKPSKTNTYTLRLHLRDNRVMLAINDRTFNVARVNDGSVMQKLLVQLERMPSGSTLTANQFMPLTKSFRFDRTIDKNGYRWLKPMLPV